MSTKLTFSILPSASLTPSTIQCTKFYSDATPTPPKIRLFKHRHSASNDMKRYLSNNEEPCRKTITKSATMPIITIPKTRIPPALLNRSIHTFPCLNNYLAEKLQAWLPSRISVSSKWSLVYSLDQHGASLNTLYHCTYQKKGPCLLVIEDSQDEIFGAYLSEGIHQNSSCYGTGECFLWKQSKSTKMVMVYPWTMLNDYLIYSNNEFFAVGGGQGKFGLWLHSDLTHGYTETCTTFNNPKLSLTSAFECVALEIWEFLY